MVEHLASFKFWKSKCIRFFTVDFLRSRKTNIWYLYLFMLSTWNISVSSSHCTSRCSAVIFHARWLHSSLARLWCGFFAVNLLCHQLISRVISNHTLTGTFCTRILCSGSSFVATRNGFVVNIFGLFLPRFTTKSSFVIVRTWRTSPLLCFFSHSKLLARHFSIISTTWVSKHFFQHYLWLGIPYSLIQTYYYHMLFYDHIASQL